jgi:ubiquinone/menaquinone biosynthesis C-methylase UbiE
VESWYAKHVLPHVLDCACGLAPITHQRQLLLPQAEGDVLEVGLGTGLNLPHYDVAKVRSLTGVEPSLQMHRKAQQRAQRAGLDVKLVGLSAETLPLPDACIDTVVCTWTLCSIPDPLSALREMHRVLRPAGRLLFCEHGRAPDEVVRRWQQRIQPLWGPLFGGCQLGRDVPWLLETGGFQAPGLQRAYLTGPRIATYNYWGEAVPA